MNYASFQGVSKPANFEVIVWNDSNTCKPAIRVIASKGFVEEDVLPVCPACNVSMMIACRDPAAEEQEEEAPKEKHESVAELIRLEAQRRAGAYLVQTCMLM